MKVKQFEFNYFGVNTYIVYDESTKEAVVIDPGMMNEKECSRLTKFIEGNGLFITHLLNTHLHIDHAMGNHFIESRYGPATEAHESDQPLGAALAEQARMFNLPMAMPEGVRIGLPIEDGEEIKFGNESLKAIHVPGHSPGSLAFYSAGGNIVISGDTLFHGSIGRTDLPGGNHNQLICSLKERLLALPEHTLVLPGHGAPMELGEEMRTNPWLRAVPY